MPARARLIALIVIAAATLGGVLGTVLGGSAERAPAVSEGAHEAAAGTGGGFIGAALPATARARQFTLDDQDGRPVSLSDYRRQVTVLGFLSTSCGRSCVLAAEQIRGALDDLPRPVPVLLISSDPRTDSPARARSFLAHVSLAGRALYLSGPCAALRPIWHAYGILPAGARTRAGPAARERAPAVILIDREGHQRVLFGLAQLTPESLAHDIRTLL